MPLFNNAKHIAVFDVETTGGKGEFARICSIAIVVLDINTFEYIEEYSFDSLINPNIPPEEWKLKAMKINELSPEIVADAPLFKDIVNEITSRINDSVLVSHSLGSDIPSLNKEFSRIGITMQPAETQCTLLMGREIFPNIKSGLKTIARELNVELGAHHQALDDALAAARIFIAFHFHEDKNIVHKAQNIEDYRVDAQNMGNPRKRGKSAGKIEVENIEDIATNDPQKNIDKYIKKGATICFTGHAFDNKGKKIHRDDIEKLVNSKGLKFSTASNIPNDCQLFVAGHITKSGKKISDFKERQIDWMRGEDFIRELHNS